MDLDAAIIDQLEAADFPDRVQSPRSGMIQDPRRSKGIDTGQCCRAG
jgi:hypothetical protein